jgi:hypothetical protein
MYICVYVYVSRTTRSMHAALHALWLCLTLLGVVVTVGPVVVVVQENARKMTRMRWTFRCWAGENCTG